MPSSNQHNPQSDPVAVLMRERRQLLQQLGNVDRQLIRYGALSTRTVEPRRQRKARKRE